MKKQDPKLTSRLSLSFVIGLSLLLLLSGGLADPAHPAAAQGPTLNPEDVLSDAFTYQGRLLDGGTPVDGSCNFVFSLWDTLSGGNQLASQTANGVSVTDGYFAVSLNFGSAHFDGDARYLAISVDCGGGATSLTPRVALNATPYALYAVGAAWGGLTDVPAGLDDGDDDTLGGLSCANGQIAKWNGSAWACSDDETGGAGGAWSLTGNSGTTPGVNYVGTNDDVSLELRVNGSRALRLEPDATSPNLVGGYSGNAVTTGALGATISGGGAADDGFGNPATNLVYDRYGTVGGGFKNRAGNADGDTTAQPYTTIAGGGFNEASGYAATVGGGSANVASGDYATAGGGTGNNAGADRATVSGGQANNANADGDTIGGGYTNYIVDGVYATIGGGYTNLINGANHATIGGGKQNRVEVVSATHASVGGGYSNQVEGAASTIAGGYDNTASGDYASIGGGRNNDARGHGSIIPGGGHNTAVGNYSLAAGYHAYASHNGCFVWADSSTSTSLISQDNDQFLARASGGFYLYSNSAMNTGVFLDPNASAWSSFVSQGMIAKSTPVDAQALLARLAQLPITIWRTQDASTHHVGPMAEDFNQLVEGLGGENAASINSLDADGVALAAIQGLYQLIQEQADQIEQLERDNADLQAELDDLRLRIEALEQAQD